MIKANYVIEHIGDYKGYKYVVKFLLGGWRCGYVAIPKGHKLYNKDYDEIDIMCHGGLTYASDELLGMGDQDVWWLGFDCNHLGDRKDFDTAIQYWSDNEEMLNRVLKYKEIENDLNLGMDINLFGPSFDCTLDYVIEQCKEIIDQINK